MRVNAADTPRAARISDYESMVVLRRGTPGRNFGRASRASLGFLVIAALAYGTWIAADSLLRPAADFTDIENAMSTRY